ncbi:MAG: hypothetical protein QOG15_2950 [Solirubrobacteraceae bacterium]|jgi:hypothetical protein|nr:hypothetical protein [Solirubrobacteraceae bacterium]
MTAGAPKVFISYRRGESAGHAGRLYDALVARFGEDNVFIDVEMEPGVDFVEKLVGVVGACDVLLVVIGPRWAAPADGAGLPRIAEADDFVRLEIRTALQRSDVRVVPLLVADARMPDPEALPDDLRALAHRNAVELSDLRWRDEVEHLMEAIGGTTSREQPAPRRGVTRRQAWIGSVLAAVVVAVIALVALRSGDSGSPGATTTAAGKAVPLTVARPGAVPPAATVRIARAGQEWAGTFNGRAGERLAVDMRGVSRALSATMTITDSADAKVFEYQTEEGLILPERCQSPLGCQPASLKVTGPHRVVIHGDSGAGELRLRLYEVPRIQSRHVGFAEPARLDLAVGQTGSVAFRSPRAGTRVVVHVTHITLGGFISIADATGHELGQRDLDTSTGFMDLPVTLPRGGTYTIHVRGNQREMGGVSVEVRTS